MDFQLNQTQLDRAMNLHRDSLVIDMHSDVHLDVIRSRGQGEARVLERRHYPQWEKGGVDVVVLNSMAKFGPETYPYRTSPVHNFLLMADAIQQEIAESSDKFLQILEPEDISRAKAGKKIGILFGTEGAEPVEQNLGFLRCYYRLGLRIMNLTWHQRNQVADGVAERSNSGLSNFGRDLVKEMNRLGILIDVSHLGRQGVRDVLEISEHPIIASHSNAWALCAHERNLEDWQIEGIAKKGGMIGVVFVGRFVAEENPTLTHVLDHLDYIAKLAGRDRVGMGPDYTDFCQDMIISSRRVAGPGQPVNDPDIPYARDVEDASKLLHFTQGLVSRGYRDDEIRGILGENFVRVFKDVRERREEIRCESNIRL